MTVMTARDHVNAQSQFKLLIVIIAQHREITAMENAIEVTRKSLYLCADQ